MFAAILIGPTYQIFISLRLAVQTQQRDWLLARRDKYLKCTPGQFFTLFNSIANGSLKSSRAVIPASQLSFTARQLFLCTVADVIYSSAVIGRRSAVLKEWQRKQASIHLTSSAAYAGWLCSFSYRSRSAMVQCYVYRPNCHTPEQKWRIRQIPYFSILKPMGLH